MTTAGYAADQTERMAESLAHFVAETKADRLAWNVKTENGGETRSVYQLVSECVLVNRFFAQLIRGDANPTPHNMQADIEFPGPKDAQQNLMESAKELADAIRLLSDEQLGETFAHPRGPILGSNLILMSYRNMAYHAGQINFIQTLYGDSEFHMPHNWR